MQYNPSFPPEWLSQIATVVISLGMIGGLVGCGYLLYRLVRAVERLNGRQ